MPTNGLLHLMQDSIVNIVNTKYESILNGYLLLHLKAVVREIIYQMFKAQLKLKLLKCYVYNRCSIKVHVYRHRSR